MKLSLKKFIVFLVVLILITGMAILSFQYLPFNIEGYWDSEAMCMCDALHFYRLKDGIIFHVSEHEDVILRAGRYEKVGYGTYAVDFKAMIKPTNTIAHSSIYKMRSPVDWLNRKRLFDKKKLNQVFNKYKWITVPEVFDIIIDEENESPKYYVNGTVCVLENLTNMLSFVEFNRRKLSSPLQVYLRGGFVPPSITNLVANSGFDFHINTNQNWVIGATNSLLQVREGNNQLAEYYIDGRMRNLEFVKNYFSAEVWANKRLKKNAQELVVVVYGKCFIDELFEILKSLGLRYRVLENDKWSESTDPKGWNLIIYDDGSCLLNGCRLQTANLHDKLKQFMHLKVIISKELVFYVKNKKIPCDLRIFLDSYSVPYRIESNHIMMINTTNDAK